MEKLTISQSQVEILPQNVIQDVRGPNSIQQMVFERLARWENGEVVPALLSWNTTDNGSNWIFTIRDNAVFHDGKDCTVDDILYAFDLIKTAKIGFDMKSIFPEYMAEWEIVPRDRKSFLVRCAHPNADLLEIFCDIFIKRLDSDGRYLGTGPYQIITQEQGRLELKTVKTGILPYEEVAYIQLQNKEERLDALLQGKVDFIHEMQTMPVFPETPGIRWMKVPACLSIMFFLNGFSNPFMNQTARTAINHLVNIQEIINEVWKGDLAIPSATVVSPFHYAYPADIQAIPHDPTKAARLLDQCSMPEELNLRAPYDKPDFCLKVMHVLKKQLEAAGFRINLDIQNDRAKYAQEVGRKKIGDISIFDSSPHSTYRVLQEKISSRRRGVWWQGVVDEKADELIDAAHKMVNPDRRKDLYSDCLRHLNQNPHWLHLYNPVNVCACRSDIQNVTLNSFGFVTIRS